MRIFSQFFLVIFSLIALGTESFATHLTGGEISYEYLGPASTPNKFRYKVTVTLTRDNCQSTVLFDDQVKLGVYTGISGAKYGQYVVSLKNEITAVGCNNCIRKAIYAQEIELGNSPEGYHITYERCCRAYSTNLEMDQGHMFYAFVPPGAAGQINSNPRLLNQSFDIRAGASISNSFLFEAADPDQHTVHYEIGAVYTGADANDPLPEPAATFNGMQSALFKSGYSSAQPFGATVVTSLDSISGALQVQNPSLTGNYFFSIAYKELINGTWYTTSVIQLHANVLNYGNTNRTTEAVLLAGTLEDNVAPGNNPNAILNWTDCFPDETAYKIYVSTNPTDPSSWGLVATVPSNTVSYTDNISTASRTVLYYKVIPEFGSLSGTNSNIIELVNYPSGVDEVKGLHGPGFVLAPNPAGSYLYLYFQTSPREIQLMNVVGQVFEFPYESFGEQCLSFDISHLKPGTYVVQVVDGDGRPVTMPLVKY